MEPAPDVEPDIVVIGASTGGPPAVEFVLASLPADFPVPIVVVQHMPAVFTTAFAARLDGVCQLAVTEAEHGDRPLPGGALIAPGGRHLGFERSEGAVRVALSAGSMPSVDVAFASATACYAAGVCAIVLTGMGNDGLEGARAVRGAGGFVVTEAQATCVIYGMPRAVERAGLASRVAALDEIPALLVEACMRAP